MYSLKDISQSDVSADRTSFGKAADFSTFIEELESTTEKLMNEVFNLPSISEIRMPLQTSTIKPPPKVVRMQKPQQPTSARTEYIPKAIPKKKVPTTTGLQFVRRSKQLQSQKELHLSMMTQSQEVEMQKIYTYRPVINKNTLDIRPISERSLQLSRQRVKNIANKRILENKRVTDEKMKECTYRPKINPTDAKKRTVEEYCKDQMRWEHARLDSAQKKKQLKQIRDNKECTFEPEILTRKSSFYQRNNYRNKGSKVEERLLASLERSTEKKRAEKYKQL